MISSHFRTRSQGGFSLIELLSVIAIMGLLAAASVPAIRSLANGNSLSAETGVISNLLTLARSEAITLRTPVQLRIVTDSWQNGTANDPLSCYRKVSLWQLQQSNPANPDDATWNPKWIQMTAWQSIGPHIVFENASDPTTQTKYVFTPATDPKVSGYAYFLDPATYLAPTTLLTTGSPQMTNQSAVNNTTADMVALEFLPTGALNTGANTYNVYLLLTQGSYNGSSLSYTEGQTPLSDWAQIRISYLTGSISVVRP
jgi:prepilin-type N-terminal cleavage/methylation domain-containing protein